MGVDGHAATTRLLTLLNVSAVKAGKREPDSEDVVEPPRAKLNGRKGKNGTSVTSAGDEVIRDPSQRNDPPLARSGEHIMDDYQEEKDSNESTDPYHIHFGAESAHLTNVARELVDAARMTVKRRKLAHFTSVVESVPEGMSIGSCSYKDCIMERLRGPFEQQHSKHQSLASSVLSTISSYQDLYHTRVTIATHPHIRRAIALHVVNHTSKKRRRVLKNNERLAHGAKDAAAEQPSAAGVQDQGFTRPSVLIVAPFRNSALKWLDAMLSHLPSYQAENHTRFVAEFSLPVGAVDKLANAPPGTYPADHVDVFEGNVDDNFRVGIKLTRKSIKLFADFYSSDIIIASPLGLRFAIEKQKSADFLSSIEVLVMDQMDSLTMQNWEHVQLLLSNLNQIPKDSHDTDFSRVKPWYLDGHARYLRQSVLLTAYETPEMRALFNSTLINVAGKVRTEFSWVPVQVPQDINSKFVKFEGGSPQAEPDKRFEYFATQVLPSVLRSAIQNANTLIFVPSYFDFVRIENHFKQLVDVSFTVLSEYSSNQDISRARQSFFGGTKAFLIMTERFYFFRRYKIRGIRNLIFYAPPEHAQFYAELLAAPFLDEGVDATDVTCRVLYSRYDAMRLERIAGTAGLRDLID